MSEGSTAPRMKHLDRLHSAQPPSALVPGRAGKGLEEVGAGGGQGSAPL